MLLPWSTVCYCPGSKSLQGRSISQTPSESVERGWRLKKMEPWIVLEHFGVERFISVSRSAKQRLPLWNGLLHFKLCLWMTLWGVLSVHLSVCPTNTIWRTKAFLHIVWMCSGSLGSLSHFMTWIVIESSKSDFPPHINLSSLRLAKHWIKWNPRWI